MKKRLRIIVHAARAESPVLTDVVAKLREEDDLHVDVRPTWEAGDALALSSEAAALGVDILVAAGGDGTLHEVVNGIARLPERPTLGIIPLGTANDFACTAGLEPLEADTIAATLTAGQSHPIDVVKVGDRFFANVATGGFPIDARSNVPDNLKRVFGGLAYLLSGVTNLGSADAQSVSVRGEGFEWSGSFYGFAVANARCAGGGNLVAPDALIDDGELDVVLLPGNESIFRAIHIGVDLKIRAVEEHVKRWTTPWIELESESPLRLNLDGEPHRASGTVRFEVMNRHVDMLLPPASPLVSA